MHAPADTGVSPQTRQDHFNCDPLTPLQDRPECLQVNSCHCLDAQLDPAMELVARPRGPLQLLERVQVRKEVQGATLSDHWPLAAVEEPRR
jgi:hypothetical protein